METKDIKYPYLPEGKSFFYVPETNEYMILCKELAEKYRSNLTQSHAAIVVKEGEVLGVGAIGNNPAHLKGCMRVSMNVPTGEGYDLCEGCSPRFHSEPSALRDALSKGKNPKGADLYFWGHWWCCQDCWQVMINAGIKDVYLLENSEILFNKKDPGNILGHQFDN